MTPDDNMLPNNHRFEKLQEEMISVQSQLKDMSLLVSQNEKYMLNEMRHVQDAINLRLNVMHQRIHQFEDRITNEVRNIYDVMSDGSDDEVLKNDDLFLIDDIGESSGVIKSKTASTKTVTNDDNVFCNDEAKFHDAPEIEEPPGGGVVAAPKAASSFQHHSSIVTSTSCGSEIKTKGRRQSAESASHRPSSISLLRRLFVRRISDMTVENKRYKSSSIHMHAAATVTDPTTNKWLCWVVTFSAVLLTIMQLAVLTTVVYEASYPTCISHDECRFGEFCKFDSKEWSHPPRCHDCALVNDNVNVTDNCSEVLSAHIDVSLIEYADIDYTEIAWGVNDNFTASERACFAQAHCDETDIAGDKCDFLHFHRLKWHATQKIAFIAMSLLFAVLLCSDIQDAIAEEILMNHGLNNDRESSSSLTPTSRLAAEVLRLAIRCRQIVLPWYATSAGIAIIITEPLTAQNILLNLLTIEVILIADDMLALLLLPMFDQSATEGLIEKAANDGVVVPLLWSRLHSVIATLVLILFVFFIEAFIDLFDNVTNTIQTCSDIANSLEGLLNLFVPGIVAFVHSVGYMLLKKRRLNLRARKALLLGMGCFFVDAGAWCLGGLAWAIVNALSSFLYMSKRTIALTVSFLLLYVVAHIPRTYYAWRPAQSLYLNLYGT